MKCQCESEAEGSNHSHAELVHLAIGKQDTNYYSFRPINVGKKVSEKIEIKFNLCASNQFVTSEGLTVNTGIFSGDDVPSYDIKFH